MSKARSEIEIRARFSYKKQIVLTEQSAGTSFFADICLRKPARRGDDAIRSAGIDGPGKARGRNPVGDPQRPFPVGRPLQNCRGVVHKDGLDELLEGFRPLQNCRGVVQDAERVNGEAQFQTPAKLQGSSTTRRRSSSSTVFQSPTKLQGCSTTAWYSASFSRVSDPCKTAGV